MRGSLGLVIALSACGRIAFDSPADGQRADVAADDANADATVLAPMIIQTAQNASAGTTTLTIPIAATGPHHLMVVASGSFNSGQQITSMTDNAGNTYVSAGALSMVGSDYTEIWYAADTKQGATSISVVSAATTTRAAWVLEAANAAMMLPVDSAQMKDNGTASTTPSAPTITPSAVPALFVSSLEVQFSITGIDATSPFTSFPVLNGNDAAYYVATTPGAYGAVWDQSGNGGYCASTVAFRAAP